jgi:hypothetical protein
VTTRKRAPLAEAELAAAEAVVAPLMREVRVREAAHRATDAEAKRVTDDNAAAYARVVEAVHALRNLVAALTDSAGYSERYDLDTALAEARAILDA